MVLCNLQNNFMHKKYNNLIDLNSWNEKTFPTATENSALRIFLLLFMIRTLFIIALDLCKDLRRKISINRIL